MVCLWKILPGSSNFQKVRNFSRFRFIWKYTRACWLILKGTTEYKGVVSDGFKKELCWDIIEGGVIYHFYFPLNRDLDFSMDFLF